MNVTMIGTGYVGLVSGVCFAELGWNVTCVDKLTSKIEALQRGEVPIYEPGLAALIESNRNTERLHFTTDMQRAVRSANVVFIAVGTPPDATGKADLQYVYAAAEGIAHALEDFTVVVTKSTVPVGTNHEVARILKRTNPNARFAVVSNPEFLREGTAIEDFMNPDRIVVGVEDEEAGTIIEKLYRPLTNRGFPLLRTDINTAEMIKYAANSFLANKIAFINEVADLCEKVGANVELVAKGMGMDERIGTRFLRPGPGFGGSCFPKDAAALAQLADSVGMDLRIVKTVIDYNLDRRARMAERVIHACGGSVAGKTIAILGLTFKANTDDMRESPSLSIIPQLLKAGAAIRAYDPEGMDNARPLLDSSVTYHTSAAEALTGTDAATIVTEWAEFKQMNWAAKKDTMRAPILVDLRNMFVPADMAALGMDYYSIGRAPALAKAHKLAKTA